MLDPIGSVAASLPSMGAAGSAADAQRFATFLPTEAAPAHPAAPEAGQAVRLAQPPASTGLGDAILGSLQRFGRSVQTMGAMGAPPPRGPAAAPLATAAPKGAEASKPAVAMDPQVQAAFDNVQHLFDEGMVSQAKMYGASFDLGLIQASMESVNKLLKTLLTQGG